MAKKSLHSPLTMVLFAVGLCAETLASAAVGEQLLLNSGVVLATAVYFYSMDDIENLIRKFI